MLLTDERGTLELDPGAVDAEGLWVTHSGGIAVGVLIEPLDGLLDVELVPGSPVATLVVDGGTGDPVADASVEQIALTPALALALELRRPALGDELPLHLYERFLRSHGTDAAGRVDLHPCGFQVVARARAGTRVSLPVIVQPGQRELTMALLEGGRALGTVHFPGGFDARADVRVQAFQRPRGAVGERSAQLLGEALVRPNGAWGPIDLAVEKEHELAFRLSGGGLVPSKRRIDPRTTDPPWVVDFRAELGGTVPVRVFELREREVVGIADARVEFRWIDEASQAVERSAAWTDADGFATLRGCPGMTGSVLASARGYASRREFPVNAPRPELLEIELIPGGVFEGRCLHLGQPVRDFDLLVWRDHPHLHTVHAFREREDGSFRVEGAPIGSVQVMAVSRGLGESGIERVTVAPDDVAQLEIELPPGTRGFGRVIDAVTGEPVTTARILPELSSAMLSLGPRGDTVLVAPDGSFVLESAPAKDALVRVEAEGYARQSAQGSYSPEGGVDFGVIALSQGQDLEVHVLVNKGVDPSTLHFYGEAATPIALQPFSEDGALLIENVQPGHVYMHVVWEGGHAMSRWEKLVAGRPWKVEFDLRADEETVIDVIVPDELEPLPAAGMFASYTDPKGNPVTRIRMVPPDRRIVIDDCSALEVWLEVATDPGDLLAFSHVRFEPGEPRYVELPLSGRTLVVSIVDGEGNPLPETHVDITTPNPDQPLAVYRAADADGRAVFSGLAFDELVVNVAHTAHGLRPSIPVRLEPEGVTELEVVLDGGQDLRVRIADGDTPIGGVAARLHAELRSIVVGDRQTGADGTAVWARLVNGAYQVRVDHPGLWPVWHPFEFRGDAEPIEVPVRRLGDVRVRVLDAGGLALAGVALGLRSIELGESVGDWLAQQRVEAEPSGLITDAQGEVHVRGLPRGPYELAIDLPGSAPVRQMLEVPPGDTLVHFVALE